MCHNHRVSETAYDRLQRKAAERALKNITSNIPNIIDQIARCQASIADISMVFSKQHQEFLAAANAQAKQAKEVAAKLSAVNLDIPVLQLDYSSLFPNIAAIQKSLVKTTLPTLQLIQDIQRTQFADIIVRARAAERAALPPNWRQAEVGIPTNLESLLLDEGLALAWVPPGAVVAKLFDASTSSQRRRIIGNHWRGISQFCHDELELIDNPGLNGHVTFALKAAESLRAGHHESAQALNANLLDTILREAFDRSARTAIVGQKKRLDIGEYPLRVAIVLGGIWGAHGEFWASKGDKIPREFSRHGSAHGVSRRQYSRVNSVIALMHVVSLLQLLNNDLRKDA